ncbi:hypothetical protein OBBRIDRAFT_808273 [Obba rivulosa]|uniref:DEAD/DEAH-box helicase domain-containing protein n=1 Tax=Obba rivulosa TaxID=1052685 RepID=A0A8E2DJ45_9APHY|nr:hypothetical protein OBBRIDRAFT_808273 [Obba rivulosa]
MTLRAIFKEQLQDLATCMRTKFSRSSDPRLFQLAGIKAQLDGLDAIIQAPTGSGKTAIAAGPHLWTGVADMTIIMVFPLLALEEEMMDTFQRDLLAKLHFPKLGSIMQNIRNHRPNVSIVIRALEHPQSSYCDLDFILPRQIDNALDIPKTYVYVDNINMGGKIVDYLQSFLRSQNPAPTNTGLVRPFNAALSQKYKQNAIAVFHCVPSADHDKPIICILVCTDAAGIWKLPAIFSNFVQRAGHAGRGRGCTGLAVLLVECSAYLTDLSTCHERSTPATNSIKGKRRSKLRAKAPKDYAKMCELNHRSSRQVDTIHLLSSQPLIDSEATNKGLLAFVQTMKCRRKVWGAVFESSSEDHHAHAHFDSSGILDDTTIGLLFWIGTIKASVHTSLLETSWLWWDCHSAALLEVLSSLKPKFVLWKTESSKKQSTIEPAA